MYFGIYDKETIKKIKPIGMKPILIRILEPNSKNESFKNMKYYNNILNLYFKDDDSFTFDDLKKLNEFIIENDFDEFAIHCSLGISRSPAIGICVAKMLSNIEIEQIILNYDHFIPNKHILFLLNNSVYSKKKVEEPVYFRNQDIYHFDKEEIDKILKKMIIRK